MAPDWTEFVRNIGNGLSGIAQIGLLLLAIFKLGPELKKFRHEEEERNNKRKKEAEISEANANVREENRLKEARSELKLSIALTMLDQIDKAVRTLPHILSPLASIQESEDAKKGGFDLHENRFVNEASIFEAVLGLPGRVALVFPEVHAEVEELSRTIRELRRSLHLNAYWKLQQEASQGLGYIENPEYKKIWEYGTDGNTPLVVEKVRNLQKEITDKLALRFGEKKETPNL